MSGASASTLHIAPSMGALHANAAIQVCLFGGLTLLKKRELVAWRGGAKTEALLLSLALRGAAACRVRSF